ncbi:hypothetical protein Tc00.1047053509233.10 [Trypanosoma cruzi]|uniref:Uncharacterized protein n=1 Tax=Trypanosoma cruzi (strain CL Brener) TaxID=353153 RepID=Q4DTY7_TRYCC|nr:hypothetical protein Tc00.1047053509233.10 [Trypanosoma cruzi]EAN95973.1 hypothetical protein Tc00.1047053509233.10 [Trypanosoma cruzi]|eukprot:XP_817824.1 hypothetical protein [Trypanosoma cruzi strain CL Brener]
MMLPPMTLTKAMQRLQTMVQQFMPGCRRKNHIKNKWMAARNKHRLHPLPKNIMQRLKTMTAAPRPPTPPPLFCFFFLLLCVRLRLRWWPRESEGKRAMHRPHTHSSFTHSLCVCPLAWTLVLTSPHEAHT